MLVWPMWWSSSVLMSISSHALLAPKSAVRARVAMSMMHVDGGHGKEGLGRTTPVQPGASLIGVMQMHFVSCARQQFQLCFQMPYECLEIRSDK